MKYINKDTHLQEGHHITDDYLDAKCRIDDGGGNYHYQNVDYDDSFRSSGAKALMEQLALDNQENLCCYCMRDLHMQKQQVTLEHVIPQSATITEFNKYTGLGVKWLTKNDVTKTDSFTGLSNSVVPPRPHTVTFENLTVSCDGTFPDNEGSSQCCNNKRGERFIYPIFYVAAVSNEITYMEDGSMHPNQNCSHPGEYRQTIEHTNLNCENLKHIRRLWHLFWNEDYGALVACLNDKNLRNRILWSVLFKKEDQLELDSKILCKFMIDKYWRTLLLYHWFYHKI